MLTRALIVLLLMLNLGVALWWTMRAEPVAPAPAQPPAGIAHLQLLSEAPPRVAPAPIASEASAMTPPTVAAKPICVAFGPFADAAALEAARVRLQAQTLRLRAREATTATATGWQVVLPPFADRAAAQAAAERIKAAGFEDYYVQPEGDNANGIALGRYGNEEAARRREAALQAAGFPAQARPLGAARSQRWIDAQLSATANVAAIAAAIGAAQSDGVDCATLG